MDNFRDLCDELRCWDTDRLREEREVTARVRNAVAIVREADSEPGEGDEDSGSEIAA